MDWTSLLPQPQQPTPLLGANPNNLLQYQLNQLRLQEYQKEIAGENALRQAAQDPANFANGQFAPQGNALQQIWQKSPQAGMEIQNSLAKMNYDQNRNALLAGKVQEDEQYRLLQAVMPARNEYEKVLRETGDQSQAQKAAQETYTKAIDDISPTLSQQTRSRLAPNFDYQRNTQALMTNPQTRAAMAEKAREDREGYTKTDEVGPGGTPRTIYTAPNKPALDMANNPVTPTGQPIVTVNQNSPVKLTTKDGKDIDVYRDAGGSLRDYLTNKPVDPKDIKPGSLHKESAANADNAQLDEPTVKMMAQQYLAGDRTVMQNLGRGAQGAQNIVKLRGEIAKQMAEQGKSGTDIATKIAEFEGLKAGERALGTRTAQMGMALNEAKTFAPLALTASEKVDRTQFPTLNSLLLAAEKGTGGEDVIRLAVATNSLLNAYARAVTPTGTPTEGAQERARELLDSAWSKGQYRTAIDQLMKEMDAASKSPGMVREEFREHADPGSSLSSPATSGPNTIMVPNQTSEAERKKMWQNAAPKTIFHFEDGSTLTKP